MIEITSRLQQPGADAPRHRLRLAFELRQKTRLRTQLEGGEDAWILLPRGEILRGGDLLLSRDGRVVEVVAKLERLLHVESDEPQALARAAYHLGNRHVPVEVGDGYLRLGFDHVLEQMLRGLSVRVSVIDAPFEPEAGAYAVHTHTDESKQAGRIHEYGARRDGS